MTLRDYAAKHLTSARRHGVRTTVKRAASEAVLKTAAPLARRRATSIWSTDWDICLVLDGCRADTYSEVMGRDGSAWSVGSASPEWISHTFHPRHNDELDTVGYVSANAFTGKDGTETRALNPAVFPLEVRLGYLDEVWRDRWNPTGELPTVSPTDMTARGMWAWQHRDRLDIDQLIVHYMQPHVPFRQRPEWTAGWDLDGFGTGGGKGKNDWKKVRDGELPRDEFLEAYRDNLEWVLEDVHRWLDTVDGCVLVTADHGNAIGELGQWGHPPRSANPAVRRVPWDRHVVRGDGVTVGEVPGDPPVVGESGAAVPTERLAALGYR